MMILVSSLERMLSKVLLSPTKNRLLSLALIDELKIISNSESNLFLVGDYKALEGILSKLKTSIIKGIEGNTKRL